MMHNAIKNKKLQENKYLMVFHQDLYFAFMIGIIYLIANLYVSGPAYQQDEIGYLVNGAFFGGHIIDGFSSYHAGYSVFLAPLFAIFDDTSVIWRGVLVINALLWSGSFFLLIKFLKRLLPSASQKSLLLTVSVVALYPAWVSMAGYAFSQSAFVFFFLVSTITLLNWNPDKPTKVILHSAAVGYLYWIHPTAIGVIAASFFTVALLCWKNRRWLSLLIHISTVSLLVLSYNKILQPWMMRAMTPSGYLPRTHYQDFSYVLANVCTSRFWVDWSFAFTGQLSYLSISTFGLFLFGVAYILKHHPNINHNKQREVPSLLANLGEVGIYLIGSEIAIIFIGAVSFASQSGGPGTIDEWFYGRYAEGVLLPLIAIGLIGIRWSKSIFFSAIAIALIGFFLQGHTQPTGLNLVNIQGFWPVGLFPNQSVFVWFSLGALALVFSKVLFSRYGIFIVIAVYLLTDYRNYHFHRSIDESYSKPSALVAFIRMNFPKGSCIAFDSNLPVNATGQQVERIRLYSYYLFNYSFRRMNVDEWVRNCDGPLLTYDNAVTQNSGVKVLGRELDTDLFIAAKDTIATTSSIIKSDMPIGSVIWTADVGEQYVIDKNWFVTADSLIKYSHVGKIEGGELSSTGHNGFLFFGPYKPLLAGKYKLVLHGVFNNGEGVIVDVVSHGSVHARLDLTGMVSEKLSEIIIPFSLFAHITDLEVRVYVTNKNRVHIKDYSVIRDRH